jgi:hypothetical protein
MVKYSIFLIFGIISSYALPMADDEDDVENLQPTIENGDQAKLGKRNLPADDSVPAFFGLKLVYLTPCHLNFGILFCLIQ